MSNITNYEASQLVLGARAGLLSRGEVPAVWLTRTPSSTEITSLLEIMVKGQNKPATESAAQLLFAIRESDKERGGESFGSIYPETLQALEDVSKGLGERG
jgi:hypothetical protein